MVNIFSQTKAAAVNSLKSSQPLGAALAFLGIDGAIPMIHGSQGCASFGLVLLGRHFSETIPLHTTAMDEIVTVLGGADRLEEAILTLKTRVKPRVIGICTSALVETRDDDIAGELLKMKGGRVAELSGTEVVLASSPDFAGAMEEGWSTAVAAVIEEITLPGEHPRDATKIAVLPGSNLTVADLEHLRETMERFGLNPIILPDLSKSLGGIIPEQWVATTYGGTKVDEIRHLGSAIRCIAIGEQMRRPAEALKRITGVPYVLFGSLTGLKNADRFISLLAEISSEEAPLSIRRRRMQLQDAMLDGHFHLTGKRIAIGSDPDRLVQFIDFFTGMGAEVAVAVSTTGMSRALQSVSLDTIHTGDLWNLEHLAAGTDLLVTHSHGRQAADRLNIPLMRVGFPVFDRLGNQHKLTILYQGTRDLIYEAANIIQASQHRPSPGRTDSPLNMEV
ncbi:Nitrogenase molybdenum-iron cofactor biosynthesis protein NifN (plasmid) [Neorhizobium galegae bv. officinalis bv. officinalis str. HAMBI 1141]|uniref:Nitrogenase iron-molybdenum cofactor biosynthesis protein NifN n=1 Tax=Neorhizobium galegae bv. officinalis bv. officinalis str. HAMBI 1141 TaxID=1028801 RepID=A0A068TJX7_NEOGA|nr:nitrogenase iron-molybdenum cofactor biosynthesis protein NifN [Neorhizobium galegae]CDN58419.1 Nitrogenase molybdenum-iron cofactor biosynthesis protein NifN [Neorhizobium galegae bv. officinalis bv. officinalis str. HAMBI 1141]